jgi:hypothetical protein
MLRFVAANTSRNRPHFFSVDVYEFLTEIYASIFSLISSVFCGKCEAFRFESTSLVAY